MDLSFNKTALKEPRFWGKFIHMGDIYKYSLMM